MEAAAILLGAGAELGIEEAGASYGTAAILAGGGVVQGLGVLGATAATIMKRIRSSSTGTTMDYDQVSSALTRNNLGGPQGNAYCQEINIKRGSKKPMTTKRLLKKIKLAQINTIARWQSLTDNVGRAFKLAHMLSYYTKDNVQTLPVYAFNISTVPQATHNVGGAVCSCMSIPFYRLTKTASNTYRWITIPGIGNTNAGTTTNNVLWNIESRTGGTAYPGLPEYTLDWINMRIMFQGATHTDSHIDLYECKFNKCHFAPLRQYLNLTQGEVQTEDEAPTGDDENELTLWWDHYLAARTCHPFRIDSTDKGAVPKAPWTMIRHKTIKFGARPDSDTITDYAVVEGEQRAFSEAVTYKKCLNIFDRYDADIILRSPNIYTSGTNTNLIVGDTEPQVPGFPEISGSTMHTMYSEPEKDHWIIISAKTYDKEVQTGDADQSWTKFPSFDLMVRQKTVYDAR